MTKVIKVIKVIKKNDYLSATIIYIVWCIFLITATSKLI